MYYTIKAVNIKVADQTAWMRRLICIFVVHIKQVLSWHGSYAFQCLQVKCENYWPNEIHEPKQYGEVVVDPVSISTMNKYNITIFHVSVVSIPWTQTVQGGSGRSSLYLNHEQI